MIYVRDRLSQTQRLQDQRARGQRRCDLCGVEDDLGRRLAVVHIHVQRACRHRRDRDERRTEQNDAEREGPSRRDLTAVDEIVGTSVLLSPMNSKTQKMMT